MSGGHAGGAGALRRLFDAAFAQPPPAAAAGLEGVLAIRLGQDPYLLRLAEIAGLHEGRPIEPVPSPRAELLGIAAVRGSIWPVYDLGALLGYAPAERPRWFVLGPAPHSIGLAFARFEGPMQLARQALASAEDDATARAHVRGVVRVEGVVRSIVDIGSVLRSLSGAPAVREGAPGDD